MNTERGLGSDGVAVVVFILAVSFGNYLYRLLSRNRRYRSGMRAATLMG